MSAAADFRLRDARPADAAAIGAVIAAAFRDAAHADGNEAEIVAALRAAGALAESVLAEAPRGPIGHVAASPATIAGAPGWFAIAPVSVIPAQQRRGVGGALMRAVLDRLRARGAQGAVILGDPGYYGRFGFAAAPGLTAAGVPAAYLLALPFAGAPPRGRLAFHPAFGIAPG